MKRHRAFTVVELLVVCGVITLLAGGLLVHYKPFISRSRDVLKARERLALRQALDTYQRRYGSYPDEPEDLLRSGLVVLQPITDGPDRGHPRALQRWKDRWCFIRGSEAGNGVRDVVPAVTQEGGPR